MYGKNPTVGMPDTVLEMQFAPSNSRTFTIPGSDAEGIHWISTTATQSPPGIGFGFPEPDTDHDSSFGPTFARMLHTPSSSNDPPSYKEVVYGETDIIEPLLPRPIPSAPPPKPVPCASPPPRETQPTTHRDVSALIVSDPLEEEAQPGSWTLLFSMFLCIMRVCVVIGIVTGILLVLWEKHYQASFDASYVNSIGRKRLKFGLREGCGWTLIVLSSLAYLTDGFLGFMCLLAWKSKDLLEHLEKVKRGTPKLTWQMTTFNRDAQTAVITDADGSVRTEERNDKITTWSGTERFHFAKWADITPDQTGSLGSINSITFHSKFVLADVKTKRAYDARKRAFIEAHKEKGQEYSITEVFEIEGFEKKMEATGRYSFVVNQCTFCIVFWSLGCFYPWLCFMCSSKKRIAYTHIKELFV